MQSIPISRSSVRPSIITPHFHKMRRCPGTSLPSGYSHNELHRCLVDSSSVASGGSSASRCRSCPDERVGVTAKHQKECAFSTTEDHFSWHDMRLNVDASVPVTGTYRIHPIGCEKYKARPVAQVKVCGMTIISHGTSTVWRCWLYFLLKNFLADLRDHHVLVYSDNTSVVSYIDYQGGLRSRPLANWRAKSSCDPEGNCCLCEQLTSRGFTI